MMRSKTTKQKISELVNHRFSREERSIGCRYLRALRSNDEELISYYDQFGDSISQLILNVRTYEQAQRCGFGESVTLNKYGWIEEGYRLKKKQTIEINISGDRYPNKIEIAELPNGKFVFGICYNTGTAGGGYCPSIWGNQFDSYNDAVKAAIEELQNIYLYAKAHSKIDRCNYNGKKVALLISRLADIKSKYFGAVQLSLF